MGLRIGHLGQLLNHTLEPTQWQQNLNLPMIIVIGDFGR